MEFPRIGQTLSSGYTVIAAFCDGGERYVLAHNPAAPEPYAVWAVDQDGDTRNGRYFTDLTRAQKRFATLCFDWIWEDCKSIREKLEIHIDANEVRELLCDTSKLNQYLADMDVEFNHTRR